MHHGRLGRGIFQRFLSTNVARRPAEEVRFPVPWGHIAGKWWGPRDREPVLAVHGWQDNANSWVPLADHLPSDIPLLAIDLPGNGRSSHLPPFQGYYNFDATGLLRRLQRQLGLGKLKLLGHSGGSSICFIFAAVFPDHTHSYFGIDYITHAYQDEDERAKRTGAILDKKIEVTLRKHSESKRYTWDEILQIWIKATRNSLDETSAHILMERGLDLMPDGKFIFSRDHRLKFPDGVFNTTKQVKALTENISCHVHIVGGLQSHFMSLSLNNNPDLLNIMKKNAKSFKLTELNGKHHLHMDMPEKIAPLCLELWDKSN